MDSGISLLPQTLQAIHISLLAQVPVLLFVLKLYRFKHVTDNTFLMHSRQH